MDASAGTRQGVENYRKKKKRKIKLPVIIILSLATGGIHPHATQVKKEYFIESDVDEALRLSACLAPYPLYVHTPPNVYNLEQ